MYILVNIGIFSPKKVLIDNDITINTPQYSYVKLATLEFKKMDLSCYTNINCTQKITLPNNKSASSFILVFQNIFNDILSISISKYIKVSQEIMIKEFGKVNTVENGCRIKQVNSHNILCEDCIEYQILKDNYHINITSNKKELLDKKLNELCEMSQKKVMEDL